MIRARPRKQFVTSSVRTATCSPTCPRAWSTARRGVCLSWATRESTRARRRCNHRIRAGGLFLLSRVEIEQRQDNRQQDNLPKRKHTLFKVAGLVVRVHVNDERAERNADHQPDDLSLEVPHK